MLFWFVGTAVLTVWFVFRDPRFDYRLLIVGSLLPAVIDGLFGGARVLHSLTFSVGLLALVMVVTAGRKPIRKTLLGLPVGTMLHLVYTGAWTNATVFWWPFFGFDFEGARHPVPARGWWNLLLEAVGMGLCWWIVQHARLREPDRRRQFWRTGQLAFM
jgi:hypothetical protein